MTFFKKLTRLLYRDRFVYGIYGVLILISSVILLKTGLFRRIEFGLYGEFFFLLALVALVLTIVGYLFLLMWKRHPAPFRAYKEKLVHFKEKPEELVAFLLMLHATSLMLSINTTFKSLITNFQPFIYDQYYAELDQLLHFGIHPWIISHELFSSPLATGIINNIYVLWFFFYWMTMYLFMLRVSHNRERIQFLISHILCWFIIGNLIATYMSSAGPVYYAHFVDGPNPYVELMARLQEHHEWLMQNIDILRVWSLGTQDMLLSGFQVDELTQGSGISAMPSMHVSIAVLMALSMGRIHKYFGLLFWLIAIAIQIGSVHLAWHYAIDGYLAAILTVIIWKVVGKLLPVDTSRQQGD